MLKLSEVSAEAWKESIGLDRMQPAPTAATPDDEAKLGPGAAALRMRDHAAIVYWEPRELFDTVIPYLREGLRAGDKVVYVADDSSVEALAGALRSAGVEVEQEQAKGRLVLVSARDAFFADGTFDVERALQGVQALAEQAKQDGFPRVRFSVEMTYLLAEVPGIERGPEFESRANEEVFARFPFVCICSFNARRNVGGLLEDVLKTHPVLISNGIPLLNPWYRAWTELRLEPSRAAANAR